MSIKLLKQRPYATVALAFLAGVVVSLVGFLVYSNDGCREWIYLNLEYVCHGDPVVSKTPYSKLEVELKDFVAEQHRLGKVERAGIFFRDLHQGPIFGVNESQSFTPASLLKLPLVLAIFTYAQDHPDVLDAKIVYSKKGIELPMLSGIDTVPVPLIEGTAYPVRELMRTAVTYSDNLSHYLLLDYFATHVPNGISEILRVFQELGVVDPRDPYEEVVSARNYSALFRLLYNASYVDKEQSELLLSWLAASSFDSGIVAGVPPSVVVANKFGERLFPDGTKGLFDCGIIYYPKNPYVLCIMTTGYDWAELRNVIHAVSEMVYKEVDSRRI